MNDLWQYISKFCDIPVAQRQELSRHLSVRSLPKKHCLLEQGERARDIFWVRRGLVKTTVVDPKGHSFTKGFICDGELVAPYVSMLLQRPADFSIWTLEPSEVVLFPYDQLRQLYASHPAWQELGRKIAEKLLIERENRIAQLMLKDAKSRYQKFLNDFETIAERIPQYEISSYLGITPIALSRIKAKIKAAPQEPVTKSMSSPTTDETSPRNSLKSAANSLG